MEIFLKCDVLFDKLSFYWKEKNRVFDVHMNDFTRKNKNLYYKLPSIVEGNYRFYIDNSNKPFHLALKYNSQIIYKNDLSKKNHTLEIVKKDKNEYYTKHIDEKKFIMDEVYHKKEIIRRANKRWNYYWYNIHYFTLNYYPKDASKQDKEEINRFIDIMTKDGIPCLNCKMHFLNYINIHKIENYSDNNEDLFRYFVELHNDVNVRNNKHIFTLEDATEKYSKNIKFEEELSSICVPLYECFIHKKTHLFPSYLLQDDILEKL